MSNLGQILNEAYKSFLYKNIIDNQNTEMVTYLKLKLFLRYNELIE